MKLTEKQKNCPYCSHDLEVMVPIVEDTELKDYQIKYILYKDGGAIDEEGN